MPVTGHTADDRVVVVWHSFADRLRTFFQARAGDDEADDLLQETMLRVVRNSERLGEARSVSGWVWTVARSVLVDHYRRRGRVVGTGMDMLLSTPVQDDDDAVRELAGCLAPMIDTLPCALAQAVRMVEIDGLSQVEAARRAGISNSGMKSRVQRGRAALRTVIARCCLVEVDVRGAPNSLRRRPDTVCGCATDARTHCGSSSDTATR